MAKLWDKGIQFDKKIESFTVGNDNQLDNILIPYDCKASIAHAKMLSKMGYINKKELVKISKILNEIIALHKKGKFLIKVSQEDCHTAIEEYLVNKIGDAGKKIHTARSRNDQALTALRLYYKEELLIDSLVNRVIEENIEEVIIATSATVEGQTTAFYIQDKLKTTKANITKLAQGLPVGGEIENLDDGTLISAFKNRHELNKH